MRLTKDDRTFIGRFLDGLPEDFGNNDDFRNVQLPKFVVSRRQKGNRLTQTTVDDLIEEWKELSPRLLAKALQEAVLKGRPLPYIPTDAPGNGKESGSPEERLRREVKEDIKELGSRIPSYPAHKDPAEAFIKDFDEFLANSRYRQGWVHAWRLFVELVRERTKKRPAGTVDEGYKWPVLQLMSRYYQWLTDNLWIDEPVESVFNVRVGFWKRFHNQVSHDDNNHRSPVTGVYLG